MKLDSRNSVLLSAAILTFDFIVFITIKFSVLETLLGLTMFGMMMGFSLIHHSEVVQLRDRIDDLESGLPLEYRKRKS